VPTPTEQFLSDVCQRSFLSLWSHPHPHRKITPVPHELCDVLVVFGNDVILFSDKSVAFTAHPDVLVNWGRWYRKAVKESAKQLFAASRWLNQFPDRVFADAKCVEPLRVPLPNPAFSRHHLIAVAWGAGDACQQFYGGNDSPSLVVTSALVGDAHQENPFHIGRVDDTRHFVHVFDEIGLRLVMHEIDTVADFIKYLNRRASLLTNPSCMVIADGEEELLASYLTNIDASEEHSFLAPGDGENFQGVYYEAGFWRGYIHNPLRASKVQANAVSYMWDTLIEHLIRSLPSTPKGREVGSNDTITREMVLRTMAAEPRLSRRMLGGQLKDAFRLTRDLPPEKSFVRVGYVQERSDTAYVFLIVAPNPEKPWAAYEQLRGDVLQAYCGVLFIEVPEVSQVVGIAMAPVGVTPSSEAVFFMKREHLSADDLERAREIQSRLNILVNFRERAIRDHVKEYPDNTDATDPSETSPPVQ
jgi:hypothetical protein